MKPANTFQTQHRCCDCQLRGDSFFCSLKPDVLKAFEAIKITNTYPTGATLFSEGEPADGVYMLCKGRVKLSAYSKDGRALILKIAEAGELLGLSAAIGNTDHEASAEVVENCQINFVRKKDFLQLLREKGDAGFNALRQLSQNYHTAYTQVCSLGLSATVGDKLAKLFLGWCGTNGKVDGRIHLKLVFSHEELAEMIGTSRETVTRILKDFRERDLISLKGSDLYINNRRRLEAAIGTRARYRNGV
jgi:CRP/FNR family cyclic AMP-dependent transcriptional regulator